MKFKGVLLVFFLISIAFIQAVQGDWNLHVETLSVESIVNSSKYKKLDFFDPGHHKTIVRIFELPKASSYILKWERPLLIKKKYSQKYSKEALINNGKFLGEDTAMLVISSRGFLPGEKITFTLETQDGKSTSQQI